MSGLDLVEAIQAVADDARVYVREFSGENMNDADAIEFVREVYDPDMVDGLAASGEIGDDLVEAYHFVLEVSDEEIDDAFADESVEFIY